jgi:5-aminopentanamidase
MQAQPGEHGRAIRVRVAQPAAGPLDAAGSLDVITASIGDARGTVDLLVLPELATTQYDLRRHMGEVAPQPGGEAFDRIRQSAAEAGLVVVLGFIECADDVLYNSAAVIEADGSLAAVVRKTHLFAGESRIFAAGSELAPVQTGAGNLGVAICYDIEFPEVARTLAVAGAEALVVLSANMHPYTDYHLTYAKARAMENGLPLVLSNWVGDGPRLSFLGRSCIVSRQGAILADAGDAPGYADAQIIISAPVDPDLNYLAHRRPDLYGS